MSTSTIAFVDDHPVLLSGVCQIFDSSDEFEVVASGTSSKDLLDIAKTRKPEVIVLDLNMPGRVLDAIKAANLSSPRTRFVAFTASSCIDTAIEVLETGVHGYVLKGASIEELTNAISLVQAGETYVTPSLATKIMERIRNPSRPRSTPYVTFSKREDEVLRLLLKGCTNKEIADALAISDKTVKHYMTVLIQKLQVRNRVEVVIAVREMMSDTAMHDPARAI